MYWISAFNCSCANICSAKVPVKNGFVVFAVGFVGIRASKSTKDAAVGPRKDSGVAHVRDLVLARLSLRPDMLKKSELSSSRPLTLAWPPSIASSNRSPSREKSNTIRMWDEKKTGTDF